MGIFSGQVNRIREMNATLPPSKNQGRTLHSRPMRKTILIVTATLANFGTGACAAQSATPDLDAIAKKVIAQEHVVGASVLVVRGDRVLLHKGYGYADLGLEAPTKDETVYHIVGPMLPFTGFAVMLKLLLPLGT